MSPSRVAATVLLALAATASSATAQRVELRGRGDADNDAFLRRLINGGAYTLLARDTLLRHNDTIPGTVLVTGATVRIEGVVAGDLVVVDGNVFLRPSARVLGRVHNIGGGLYPSELATVQGGIRSEPNAPYRSRELEDGTIVIHGDRRESLIVWQGAFGFRPPTYDRVDGVKVGFGAGYLLPRIERIEPLIRGRVEYRSQRGVITGGAELELPRGRTELGIGAERTTLTNEAWIQPDIVNSVTYLLGASDRRDYYEADRGWVEARRVLESGPRTTSAFLRVQLEDARPLAAGAPWTFWGTPRAENVAVIESRIASASAATLLEWTHPVHIVRAFARLEWARAVAGGDHSFAAYTAELAWATPALADHTLGVRAHATGPLPGTRSLPQQRWSFVGGTGTLPTFPMAAFRGDRVAHVETRYIVPTRVRVRFLGSPDLELMHMAGMAWTADHSPPLEQNVGLALRFSLLHLGAYIDPADAGRPRVVANLALPRPHYPWHPDR
jgi:hypothetical protein